MEFVTSQKSQKQLVYKGYIYKKERSRNSRTYWTCVLSDCRGRAISDEDVEASETKPHNHAPDQSEIEARRCFGRLKDAAQGHGKTAAIVNAEIAQKVPLASQGALPKESSLRRRIQRERRKNFPQLPMSQHDLVLEGKWRQTESGDDWIIYDEVCGEDRIVIFATNKNLETIMLSKVWYGDGTFDVSPPFFLQLYTLHCDYMGRVLPMIYCLLPRKSRAVYETMFLAIRHKMTYILPGFEPCVEKFRMDFEGPAYAAALSVFPSATFEGCFFHFSQANWRNLVNCGFRQRYIEDAEFALTVKEFTALAFLPEHEIRSAFYALKDAAPPELSEYIAYFERTYIGTYKSIPAANSTQMRFVWKEPLYIPPKWSVYKRVLDDDPRTTNFLEGWHRRFSVVVGESHPNIFKFIGVLIGEQSNTEMRMLSLLRGDLFDNQKQKEQLRNKRIKNVVENLTERGVRDTLRGVAYNVQYQL